MTDNKLFWATLDKNSKRYWEWRHILGKDELQLKAPSSQKAKLGVPVKEECEVYEVDVDALDVDQLARLIAFCSSRFGAPMSEVAETIAREGFPIRAEDVVVAFSMRAFV